MVAQYRHLSSSVPLLQAQVKSTTRKLALSVMFLALLASLSLAIAKAPTFALHLPASITQADKRSERFDGQVLYKAAFQALLDLDLSLHDPATCRAWVTRYSQPPSGPLTEAATDAAVRRMIAALGERYNFYLAPQETKNVGLMSAPEAIGLGFFIKIHGADQTASMALRALGAAAKTEAAQQKVFQEFSLAVATEASPVEIAEVFPGSRAEQAGITAGDKILKVNGVSVTGLNLPQVLALLRGSQQKTLSLMNISGQIRDVNVTPGPFTKPVVHTRVFGDIAYIKLDDFMSEHAGAEMTRALNQARSSRAVVLDLRGNLGGRIDTAIDMIQRFLPTGQVLEVRQRKGDHFHSYRLEVTSDLLVTTQWQDDHPADAQVSASARVPQLVPSDMPVVVLVDGNSYSASEMLAGALQANRRAVIVGQPTGGKGLGQLVIPLPYGRTLDVTNLNFRPGGATIDWIGVVPEAMVVQPPDAVYGYWPSDQQFQVALQVAYEQLRRQGQLQNLRTALCRKHHLNFDNKTPATELARLCPAN